MGNFSTRRASARAVAAERDAMDALPLPPHQAAEATQLRSHSAMYEGRA